MKNKLCYILLGVLLNFSFMSSVFAEELEFTISATADKTEVVRGDEALITLNLKSDIAIANCRFSVETDSGIVFSSTEAMNGWYADVSDNLFVIHNGNITDVQAYTSGKNVFNLKYTVNNDGKITLKNIECVSIDEVGVDADGNATEVVGTSSDVSVSFTTTEVVEDTSLSSLKVTGGTLAPEFSSNETSYIIDLDSLNFGLSMTASNPDYQDDIVVKNEKNEISDWNNISFKDDNGMGQMRIDIIVNGKTTYSLLVRYEQGDLDNSLKYIKINGSELNLVDGEYDYEYTVPSSTKSFNVEAMLNDSDNFEYVINGGDSNTVGNFNINDVVYVIVEVKFKDSGSSSSQYNIKVVKEGTGNTEEPDDDKGSSGGTTSGGNNSGNNSNGNANYNPGTGSVSMIVMAFILIVSLVGSIVLYQKNMESYK